MLTLGIDVGTTTITAVVFDPAARTLLARATLPNRAACTPQECAGAGWAEIDLGRVLETVRDAGAQATAGLSERSREIHRIGITGQMHGVAFLDSDAQPVRSAITWQYQRARPLIAELIERAGGAGAFANMGCLPATGYLGATAYWLSRHDALPAAEACTIPDAVAAMLAGLRPRTDPTLAASTGLFDIAHRQWAWPVLTKLGLSTLSMPALAPAGSTLGKVHADIAQTWDVAPNTTICVAVGDHQASLIGSGCDQSGHVHVNLGTGGQVSMVMPEFAPADAPSGLETRPFVDGCFIVTGASLCGGEALALLQRFFSDAMVRLGVPAAARPAVDAIYTALVAAAGEVDDGEFRATTQFDGTRHDPSATASFTGLTRANFTAAHLARATLRGIADELGAFYDAMRARHGAGIALSGSGNALRLNPLLATFVAERLGLSLAVPAWEEEAAVGAAILAGRGAGAGRG